MNRVDTSDFIRKMNAVSDAWKKIPDEVAATAVNFSKERFREQSWLDSTKENWKPRKRKRKGGKTKSQTLLVNTGRLKRSIRKVYANENSVLIGTDVPYAQIQNDGFNGSVTQHVRSHKRALTKRGIVSRKQLKRSTKIEFGRVKIGETTVRSYNRTINQKIPSRRFIGNSLTLERRIYLLITSRFMKALKQ